MVDAPRALLWLWLPLLFSYSGLVHLAGAYTFLYSGFAGANLTLDGTATVTPAGLLELTNGTVQKSHAFHPTPLRLRSRSFSASFVFGIVPAMAGATGGHGIALVVAPTKDLSSSLPSAYLGVLNKTSDGNASSRIFAVELDTAQSQEFHDIDNNHVGIDINNLISVAAHSAGYWDDRTGEFRNLTLVSGEAMQAWVDYDTAAARVDVTLAPAGARKPGKTLVSAGVDLSTVIAEEAYVGFSSATGTQSTRHYVLAWSFSVDDGPAPAIDVAKLPKLPLISNQRSKDGHTKQILLATALPIAGALALAAVGACLLLLMRRLRHRYVELREDWEVEFGAHRLPYKDLFHATDGFNAKNLLGAGGFGRVYRGVLPTSGTEVAVKRVSHESRQGMKEFVAEVASIGRLRHRNLVQLLGYGRLQDELLLVYDYMPNGSLDRFLYGGDNRQQQQPTTTTTLNWAQRFQVIKGVAAGLLYLHEEWEQVVIHRDVKASNVLLDGDMSARLGDFGLARLRGHNDADADLQTTAVAGTFGYIAPELALTGKASPRTDVFAFGAFLLEVITGRRPAELQTVDDGNRSLMLVDWVFEHWRRETLVEAVDPRIQAQGDVDELILALKVGLLCSQPVADARPSMRQVMQYLEGDTSLPEMIRPAHHHVGLSMLAMLQNHGFDSYAMASSSSSSSVKTLGICLSRGR